MTAASPLSVLVTVGSDHHPFDRLIGWVDDWLTDQGDDTVRCVLQYGTAATPRNGTPLPYLPHSELQELLREAQVVVTQGGPMGIIESLQCGTRPIAVPRLARLGEVVDDHQVAFCRQLAAVGKCRLAEDASALREALGLALRDPEFYTVEPSAVDEQVARSVAEFGQVIRALRPRRGLLKLRRS